MTNKIKLISLMWLLRGSTAPAQTVTTVTDLTDSALRIRVTRQQEEIDELRATLKEQRLLLNQALAALNIRTAAPAMPQPLVPKPVVTSTESPFTLHAGKFDITPGGFFDLSAVFRASDIGSGLGTSFTGIPYTNTASGKLSETRLSAQNSRFSLRLGATFGKTTVLGYLETDFLGNQPANGVVSSNGNGPRMRLGWLDLKRGKWEILTGQAYSFLTPNRTGVSSVPRDVFLTQAVDPNFHVGLTWTRAPQVRVVFHPNKAWSLGLALENPEQFVGGAVALPVALATPYATQVDNGSLANPSATPNVHPDILPKIAYDGILAGLPIHLEAVGLARTFRVFNSLTNQSFTNTGWGGSLNGSVFLAAKMRLFANTFWSDGGGRYIFGLGPDLIVRADGSVSPVKAGSGLTGFEYQATPRVQAYGYYGGAYFARNSALDSAGRLSGYGYTGSSAGANRAIQQATAGFVRILWKDAQFGTLQVNSQYSYLVRSPWFVGAGQPKSAHTNQVYVDLRYVLP